MLIKPTRFDDSVNVTRRHPLSEFLAYCAGITILAVGGYWLLGILLDLAIPFITPEQEQWLWRQMQISQLYVSDAKPDAKIATREKRLQALLDRMPKEKLPVRYDFTVHLVDEAEVNALALPGGTIVVYTGLLDKLDSENAAAFVLGHELGHFAHRDHLRGLGRGLVGALATAALFGQDSGISGYVNGLLLNVDNSFTRAQEEQADAWGLEMLIALYGHAGGATEFFEKMRKEESESALMHYGSTHPLSADRIAHLNRLIQEKGMKVEGVRRIEK